MGINCPINSRITGRLMPRQFAQHSGLKKIGLHTRPTETVSHIRQKKRGKSETPALPGWLAVRSGARDFLSVSRSTVYPSR